MSLFSRVILSILLFYDFPMTAFRWPYMLDEICFPQLLQLLLDAIRRYADDFGKLLASSKRMRAYLVQYHFLGTFARFLDTFLGTARVFLGTFLLKLLILFICSFYFRLKFLNAWQCVVEVLWQYLHSLVCRDGNGLAIAFQAVLGK